LQLFILDFMCVIAVENLCFAYESHPVLANISLELEAGQILAIVGESGEGKSTLLQLLAGLLQPNSGNILIDNEILLGPRHKLIAGHADVKLVAQDFRLNPNFTVAENIAYPIRTYTRAFIQARVAELCRLFGINHLAQSLPKNISGGERQRTALAMALADVPKLLLMDEPFSNLDNINKAIAKEAIAQYIVNEQVACIFVSHDLHDVGKIAHEVAFLKGGIFVDKIPVNSLKNYAGNAYVRAFIDAG
jgi:ABC-type sugar transport system ATPase subunit